VALNEEFHARCLEVLTRRSWEVPPILEIMLQQEMVEGRAAQQGHVPTDMLERRVRRQTY
jgi:hypothetical protein